MNRERFQAITAKYPLLSLAVVGDICLDRYLEIDPARQEVSIETRLPVHNVVNIRSQPGAAGTILNNLVALGVGKIFPVGFCGQDGEGYELLRALEARTGVRLDYFVRTTERRTFTYCKPLLVEPGKPPLELNRLDSKNWTPTPAVVQERLASHLLTLSDFVDALIVMDQVDTPETGVVTAKVLETIKEIIDSNPRLLILADSRRGLRGYPPVILKMNASELASLTGAKHELSQAQVKLSAAALARQHGQSVFVTLADRGILAASPAGEIEYVPALPVHGPIDIVGAGDAVTANVIAALAADATLRESLELANAAASIVIHQLGTTGTASLSQMEELLFG